MLRAVPVLVTRRAPQSPTLSTASIRRLARAMLQKLELSEAELSVLLTDDATIHALNREHRHKDRPTDVLAFPLDEDATGVLASQRILGDVVISLDTAQRQAQGRRRPLIEEVRFLLAHGLLHLIGFDHDTAARKQRMVAMTRELVRAAPLDSKPRLARKPRPRAGKR